MIGLFGAFFFAAFSRATTIDTYSFTQGGYGNSQSVEAPFAGSFSGAVEPNGLIELSDLISFSLFSNSTTPSFFSFNTNGGASSLDTAVPPGSLDETVCIGATAAFGGTIAGTNCGAGGSLGYNAVDGLTFTTNQLPDVTLISSVTNPAPAPEPGTLTLSALASLIFLGMFRSRFSPGTRQAPPILLSPSI
ncbi:MAG TPA: hypothetical protein VGL97_19390 [Bryobacteraceae bacterium]